MSKIPEKMHAVRLNAPNELEYVELPVPKAGEYEVLVRVESVSICGTDPHIIAGDFPGFWPQEFPLIPGHEWSGVIVDIGDKGDQTGFKEGDRVCGIANCGCGICKNCMEGRFTICLNYGNKKVHRMYGHITDGAYAQYMVVNMKTIAKIPDELSFDIAACLDPLSIALHTVMHSRIEPGDTVLVNGAGAQGLMAIICAKTMGAGFVMCADTGNRLQAAEKLGAVVIDFTKTDVVDKVMDLTGGLGAKRVIECTGSPAGVRNACFAAARGGSVSVIGLPKNDVEIPVKRLVLDEIEFVGNRANPNTLEKSIPMALQHKKEIESLITHVFPLKDYAEALDVFVKMRDGSLKVVMKPQLDVL